MRAGARLGWPRVRRERLGGGGQGGRPLPLRFFSRVLSPGLAVGARLPASVRRNKRETDRSKPRAQQRPGPTRPRHALAHWPEGVCGAWLPAGASVPSGGDVPTSGRRRSRRCLGYRDRTGEGSGCTSRGAVVATLQPEDIPCRPRRGRGDAGAGGSGAEVASHWLGAGYPRRKRGRRGGSRSARSGGDSGSNISQFDPGGWYWDRIGFFRRSGLIECVGLCGGCWGLGLCYCGFRSPHSPRPTPFTRGHIEALVSPFLLAGVGFEDVF